MNVDEAELIGEPLDDVPQRQPDDECNGRKSSRGAFDGYCNATAGRGTDHVGEGRCKHHGGAADNRGEKNGNFEHGAYAEFVDFQRSSLTDDERDAIDAIDFDDHADDFAEDVVREAYAKYLRTGDSRFLQEARQWAKDFGVIESPADQLEVDAHVESETEHSLDDGTKEIARDVLRERRERDEG